MYVKICYKLLQIDTCKIIINNICFVSISQGIMNCQIIIYSLIITLMSLKHENGNYIISAK